MSFALFFALLIARFRFMLEGMSIIADTLEAKKTLLEAGVTEEVAEGIIKVFNKADTQVATKMDLELFHKDIKAEFASFRAETDARFEAIEARFEAVDARFENLQLRMTNLIVKAQLAGFVAVVAALSAFKFFS